MGIDSSAYFSHVLTREQCFLVPEHNTYVKDLGLLLGGRSLRDILIIDNKVESFSGQLDNGIPIPDYTGDATDAMLFLLRDFLLDLHENSNLVEAMHKSLDGLHDDL